MPVEKGVSARLAGSEGPVSPQVNPKPAAESPSGDVQPLEDGTGQPPAPATSQMDSPSPAANMNLDVQNLLAAWKTATQSGRRNLLERVQVHGRPALDLMLGYLSSPDSAIRLAAVGVVGSLGDRSCLPAVQALLTDSDRGVVQTAQWAVGVLESR